MKSHILLFLMTVILITSVPSVSAQQCNAVTIGALVPQTGSLQNIIGSQTTYAIQQAINDFNEYLVDNQKDWCLEVDIQDTNSEADTALTNAETLINRGVEFISGPAHSDSINEIKPIVDDIDTNLSLVSYYSTSSELAITDNIFRLAPSHAKHGSVIANLMHIEGKTVVIPVHVDDSFGRGLSVSTISAFEELDGTAIYQTSDELSVSHTNYNGILSYSNCTDKNGDVYGNANPTCDDQFPSLISDLNDIVIQQIKTVGADKIFIFYVGFNSQDFISEASKYPALRLVQWVGSDVDVLKTELVDDSKISEFLTDTNFRTYTFEFESDTDRFASLNSRLTSSFSDEILLKYVYSAYDSIWVIGLAIDAAGGANYDYDGVDLTDIINNYDDGSLGNITLDKFGDLTSVDFGVFGIEDNTWQRIGTYYADGRYVISFVDDTPVNVINIDALLDLGNAPLFDDDFAVTFALASRNFETSDVAIKLTTIDITNGVLPALNAVHYGVYDDFYHDELRQVIDDVIDNNYDSSDMNNPFSAIPNDSSNWNNLPEIGGDLLYPFVINSDGIIVEHGFDQANLQGKHIGDLIENSDREFSSVYNMLSSDGGFDEMWYQYEFVIPDTDGQRDIKRSLLVYHEESGLVIGSGYYPPLGDDGYGHDLMDILDDVITTYDMNSDGNKFVGITGAFDKNTELFYPFVINVTASEDLYMASHGYDPSMVGPLSEDIANTITNNGNITITNYIKSLRDSGGAWLEFSMVNFSTGLSDTYRSWVVAHDTDDLIFGTGYFVKNPTRYFVGPTTSSAVAEAISFIELTDSILVSPVSSAISLALLDDDVYRLIPNVLSETVALSDIISQDQKTSFVIAHLDDIWGNDYAGLFDADVANIHSFINNSDYTNLVTSLESSVNSFSDNTDVALLFIGSAQNFIDLSDEVDSDSILNHVSWYGSSNLANDITIIDDDFANQVNLTSVSFGTESNIISLELQDELESFGITFTTFSNAAYDSVFLLGNLLESNNNYESVRALLKDTIVQYDGALGTYSLDVNGDLRTPNDYQTFRVASDGKWQRVDKTIVNIGAIIPETGRQDNAGAHRKYSTLTAVSDFNQYLLGKDAQWRLSIDTRDSQTNADFSLQAATSLYDDGVSFISGPSISAGLTKIKTDLIDSQNADLSLVSCCSTAESLQIEDNIFRLAPSDDKHGIAIANLMYNDGKKLLIPLYIDNTFGSGLAQTTSAEFEALGGMTDSDNQRKYTGCSDSTDITCDGQFPSLVSDLANTIANSPYSTDEIAILYVGFDLEDIIQESMNYPILRQVSWTGSDSNVLSSSLVDDPLIRSFMSDVNFRSCIFDADRTSTRFVELKSALDLRFQDDIPSVYAFSSYDSIWAIGLAMEQAGISSSVDDIASNIPDVVQRNNGALGNVSLDEFGDLSDASYAVYGINDEGWYLAGTYYVDRGFESIDTCQISLQYSTIDHGDADAFSLLTDTKQQTITNTGVQTIDTLRMFSVDNDSPISVPLTEVYIDNTWMHLDTRKDIATNLESGDSIDVSSRMNFKYANNLLSSGISVSQNISYQTICTEN